MDFAEQRKITSEKYMSLWNPDEQARIDEDIEKYRKADFSAQLEGTSPGRNVHIEQISHDFTFGAHIFNFDQLGSDESNERYKKVFGELFNSATIAFYWKCFEPEEGKPRFSPEYQDSAEFWNRCPNPKEQPHWRRPASDPVVEFCEKKGVRRHGHVLWWGNWKWQYPRWLASKMPEPYGSVFAKCGIADSMPDPFAGMEADEIAALMPGFVKEINTAFVKRTVEIALHYADRLQSWDVVNESAEDVARGLIRPGAALTKSRYGIMPGDYDYRAFQIANAFFPRNVRLNINDYSLSDAYRDQTLRLIARGCRVSAMGAQMHLFNPQQCLDIADGRSDTQCPASVRDTFSRITVPGLPVHLSEITITSPGSDARGEAIQAVIAENLYRLWFSLPQMYGITWWNAVDDCGAPGEPSVSGLFHRDMTPKASFFALDELLNNKWKTRLDAKTQEDGLIKFRGFKGDYRIVWEDDSGVSRSRTVHVE